MNFLAHLYLSGENEEIIIGNFIADHVKGKAIDKFSDGIKLGILLHREIDRYTDSHPVFISTKNRLAVNYKKYAGVIADMFYDHFLSANWMDYSDENIDSFTHRMYKIIMKKYFILPPKTKRLLPFMAKDNWLKAYGTIDGLERALSGMARRTPFESGMENAVTDLIKDYDIYKSEFDSFFSEIKIFVGEMNYPPR
ncbi:MAG: ACP phosphodiesterase [Bacteroidales bacterium]|nr:ACP phosphodiesterase [Bacteroidales bacterium]MCF8403214.1 ACP phosphodiesterase [Bacteroidales bacterium]